MLRTSHGVIGLLALLLTCTDAGATPPGHERHSIGSPNGAFVLEIYPRGQRNTVYVAGDHGRPLWYFYEDLSLREIFLSNECAVVSIIRQPFVHAEDLFSTVGVQFRNKDGVFRSYSV